MKELTDELILLKQLTLATADDFYNLYSQPELTENFSACPFLPGESPEEFTARIISVCEFIWTIRLAKNPEKIIGDCALHHWNPLSKEIEIGGSLLPAFRGRNYMKRAFLLAETVAHKELGTNFLLGVTESKNVSAIRMAEKSGFRKISENGNEVVLRKELQDWI